jgi:hypothetical protein
MPLCVGGQQDVYHAAFLDALQRTAG